MNVALWIGHFALMVIFTVSGLLKSTQSKERMIATGQTSAKIVPLPYMRLAGGSELLAVAGLILPWVTGIARVRTRRGGRAGVDHGAGRRGAHAAA